MIHRVRADIDLSALKNNFQVAKARAGGSRTAVIIKANAYGHGLLPVAAALQDADLYAVTDVHEAARLRQAGTDKPILVLQGLMEAGDLQLVLEHGLQLLVHSLEQLSLLEEELGRSHPRRPLTFWLKADTGMGRLGIAPADYAAAFRSLAAKPYSDKVIMLTHLANASLPGDDLNARQLAVFRRLEGQLGDCRPLTSIPSSAGLLTELEARSDWARPGLMLYGSSPFAYQEAELRREKFGLRAAMTLRARLIAIKDLKRGDNVGYCSQFVCPRDMRVGIVAIGYGDGYPSTAPNGTPVEINGRRTGTLGRVSMDMIAIDLSDMPQAQAGDMATLWGEEPSLDEVAAKTGILSYHLTCGIAARVAYCHG